MVPDGWRIINIGSITNKVGSGITPQGGRSTYLTKGIPFIRSQNVLEGYLDLSDVVFISDEQHKSMQSTHLKTNDVLLTISGASIGRSCVVPSFLKSGNVNQHVCIIRCDGELNSNYLSNYLNSWYGQKLIWQAQAGGNREGLNYEQIKAFKLAIPPIREQRLISDSLLIWDNVILYLTKLIISKNKLKTTLMQQLLTGKRRFKEFNGQPWREFHLGVLVNEENRQVQWNDNEIYRLASVRRWSGGLFLREELIGNKIKVKNLKTIKTGDFLISHIQSAYGAMSLVTEEFDGTKVSDLYTVLTTRNPKQFDIRFLGYLSQCRRMWHLAYLASNGFFAERLRLNFNPIEFLKHIIYIPVEIKEQHKIIAMLDVVSNEIKLLNQQLELYKKQKRGLVQKLLTGQIRVKGSNHAQ